ncbi:MAG: heavy metal-associated domain-containing protein, partial [bacterium]
MNQKISLKIQNMTCASCAATIERALKKTPGVKSININLASEKAYLEYDPAVIMPEQIKQAIAKAGYKSQEETIGHEHQPGPQHDHHHEATAKGVRKLRNTFLFSLILGLPIFYLMMAKLL